MALQSSGPIKFSDIGNEFGYPPAYNIGAYRLSQSIAGRNWPLDTGVPSSGPIKFSNFYNKTLNIVIDSGTGADEFDVTLTNYWSTKIKTCVGGFKTPDASLATQGAKVYNVVLRRDYGGSTTVNTSVKTGAWPSGSTLNVYVSGNATVYGRGGRGGSGGWGDPQRGGNGTPGLNAIGFSYSSTLTIDGGSAILAGAGGGGGGGGNHHNPDPGPFDPTYRGGDGGGGRGNPAYSGGSKSRGGDGGGGGGSSVGRAGGGGGGGGWSAASIGSGGGTGASNGTVTGSGGGGGGGGAGGGSGAGPGSAIVRSSAGVTVTVVNNGTVSPNTTVVTTTIS